MGTGHIMIATALGAALAVLAPTTQDLSSAPVPYSSMSQASAGSGATYQGRVLSDQDTALFRQGLVSARARDVISTQATMARISDPTARKLVEWALVHTPPPPPS